MTMRRTFRELLLLMLALTALAPGRAFAWDEQADRLVADLAYQRLTPAARADVDALVAGSGRIGEPGCRVRTLADGAALMECLRGSKQDPLKGLVFDPIPICGPPPPDLCRKGRCVSQAAKRALDTLRDAAAPPPERGFALLRLAFFMAELHQPLHAADNSDKSGHEVRVTLPGSSDRRLNLYDAWDQYFVAEAVGTEETGLPYLEPLAEAHGKEWAAGDLDTWLAESHRVAVQDVYGRLPDPPVCGTKSPDRPQALRADYVEASVAVVRAQLAKAGVRLAALLNATLR